MLFSLFFDLHTWLAAATLSSARLAPVFFMLPFLNGGVLTGAPRLAVILLVAMSLWPLGDVPPPAMDALAFAGTVLREAAIGVVLGGLLCWPLWVLHGMGNLIDNQRGATLGNTVDPVNGVDTSELANFLQLFGAVMFLEAGGMTLVMETFQASYRLCPPLVSCELAVQPLLTLLDPLMAKILAIAAPVIAMLLTSEALLGLLARFAPQMNAFSVSLTIKSAIAFGVLLLYFGTHLPDEVSRMGAQAGERLGPWLIPAEER